MTGVERPLRVVTPGKPEEGAASSGLEDLGVTVMIFLVAALPLVSAIAGFGHWSEGSLGLGTVGVLLAGRELCARAFARCSRPRCPPSSIAAGALSGGLLLYLVFALLFPEKLS